MCSESCFSGMLPQWKTPEELPIRFLCGGKPVCGIPAQWNPRVSVHTTAKGITETTVTGISPEGLELRVIHRTYPDYAAAEYVAFLTNRGTEDSPLVEKVRFAMDIPGSNAVLYHGNGDTWLENGYEWWYSSLAQHPQTLSPIGDGTSCNGAFPYMRLLFENRGLNIAVGWTGTWIAELAQNDNAVAFSSGQRRCRMVIHPGETMRVPSLTFLAYEGNEDAGRNTWRRFYFDHILPQPDIQPKCCMHLLGAGGKPEFTGATEENQLEAMNTYLQKGIKPDVWWIDAGWYPCDFEWHKLGNWYPNPDHFPRGLKPIGDACKRNGMDFLLWFEPERIHANTRFYEEHPQWLLHYVNIEGKEGLDSLVNLGDPACCDYVIDLLDGIVKESGVSIYRQDFNGGHDLRRGFAGKAWIENEAADRIGALENLHIQGYYRMWDSLLERNPGLLIDSCASGGRRNDIETMRRSVTLHYTDVGYGNHPVKLKQHRQMFEWIPYFRAHNQNWWNAEAGRYDYKDRLPDRYSYYVAMAPAMTDMLRFDADEEAFALAREMQAIWREAARYMLGTDYYPLTQCRKFTEDFYAAQFYDPKTGEGIVHMVNGITATETQFTVQLRGLDPEKQYVLRSVEKKQQWQCSGAQLLAGIPVTMEKKTGDLWFYHTKP